MLDGAIALALPTQLGQQLTIQSLDDYPKILLWESFDYQNNCWFSAQFSLSDLSIINHNNQAVANRLQEILKQAKRQSPHFLENSPALKASTHLEFPNEWGLGTSSTLINSIADWAKIDPYILLKNTFGGSGYDIACASAKGPITYQRKMDEVMTKKVNFNPAFQNQLYFVYLGKKQNSREAIKHYRETVKNNQTLINEVSDLTRVIINIKNLSAFEQLIEEHELIVAKTLQLERAKKLYFPDYWGQVKSLGAWGGDFVLVTSNRSTEETQQYFNEKGFQVFINYKKLILNY